MTIFRQMLARQVQVGDFRGKLAKFESLIKGGELKIDRPIGAVMVLVAILTTLGSTYWFASNSLSAAQMNYSARQELLDVLHRRSRAAGIAMRRARDKMRDPFLSAQTETLAASLLDDQIRRVASEVNGTVSSSHPEVEHDAQSAGNKIEIKAVIDGKIGAVQALLFQLETSTPIVFVNEISLETKDDNVEGGGVPTDPDVHMAATFVAYWRPPVHQGGRR